MKYKDYYQVLGVARDADALALALTLFNRIRELEAQLRKLQAQLPRRSA